MYAPSDRESLLSFLDFELPAPQVTQDTDLLRQLSFIPGLKELLTVRQVHALEHATVWVLSHRVRYPDIQLLGGLSTEQGFYLSGRVSTLAVQQATTEALERITAGEWGLAVHPECGTNLSVGMLLAAGLASGVLLCLPKGPVEQLLGLGFAGAVAAHITPDLGRLAQRYVTTAIPFNLVIAEVTPTQDVLGRPAHFVRLHWIE